MSTWTYLTNPFLVAGSRSRTKANKISTFTDGALFVRQADAFFGPLYAFYHPLHVALNTEDAEWRSQIGAQKSKTQSLDELLKELSPGKVYNWDLAVQNVFAKGTPGYTAVFPQGHKPFQHGGKDERVTAVETLVQSLGAPTAPPAFAPIKTDAGNFLTLLLGARASQTGAISQTESESDETTVAVTKAMNGLYKILGDCIGQFPDNPTAIEPLFDLQTIRNLPQSTFTDHVSISSIKNIFKRTVEPTDMVRIKVNSTEPLTFYFAEEKNDEPGMLSVTVAGLEEETVEARVLGNVPSASWFKAQNKSALAQGQFEVEIL